MDFVIRLKKTIDFLIISKDLHERKVENIDENKPNIEKCYLILDNLSNLDKERNFKLKGKPVVLFNRNNMDINKRIYIPEIHNNLVEYDLYSDYYLMGVMTFCIITGNNDITKDYRNDIKNILDNTSFCGKKDVYDLFYKCFVDGEKNRISRPNEDEYLKVLNYYYNQIITCPNCESLTFIEDILSKKDTNVICRNCLENIHIQYFSFEERIYRDRSFKNIKVNNLVDKKIIGYYSFDVTNNTNVGFIINKRGNTVFINSYPDIKIWLKRGNHDFDNVINEVAIQNGDEIFIERARKISTSSKSYNYILVAKYTEK